MISSTQGLTVIKKPLYIHKIHTPNRILLVLNMSMIHTKKLGIKKRVSARMLFKLRRQHNKATGGPRIMDIVLLENIVGHVVDV